MTRNNMFERWNAVGKLALMMRKGLLTVCETGQLRKSFHSVNLTLFVRL